MNIRNETDRRSNRRNEKKKELVTFTAMKRFDVPGIRGPTDLVVNISLILRISDISEVI